MTLDQTYQTTAVVADSLYRTGAAVTQTSAPVMEKSWSKMEMSFGSDGRAVSSRLFYLARKKKAVKGGFVSMTTSQRQRQQMGAGRRSVRHLRV